MNYRYQVGDRVRSGTRCGEVTSTVPGNGSIEWYFVRWEDGNEDRHTADELEHAYSHRCDPEEHRSDPDAPRRTYPW